MNDDHDHDNDKQDQGKVNPTQGQQNAMAGQSPAKEPAHETAKADPGKMAQSFANTSPAGQPLDVKKSEAHKVARNVQPLPDVDVSLKAIDHPDPVIAARSRIVSHDTAGTQATDGTVDTDGKGREARRERTPRHDHFVNSNASLDEHVPTSPFGIGGIDSRIEGPGIRIAARPGWRVVDLGTSVRTDMNGPRASRHIRFEPVSGAQDANPGAKNDLENDDGVVHEVDVKPEHG